MGLRYLEEFEEIITGEFDIKDLGRGLPGPFSILEWGEVVPDRDEIDKVWAEPSFAVAIEADPAIDALDTAGRAVKLVQHAEEKRFHFGEVPTKTLKLLFDGCRDH